MARAVKLEVYDENGNKVTGYPRTITEQVIDPVTGKTQEETNDEVGQSLKTKSGIPEEKTIAQSLTELNAKIEALEEVATSKMVERMDVVKDLNLFGKTNMVLSGSGAPSFAPDFIGQRYLDLTAKVTYTAYTTDNAGGWK